MGILGIAVAYGGFRLIYLKSDDPIKYMWYIDILSVLLTIVALIPATVKFTSAGKVISKLGTSQEEGTGTIGGTWRALSTVQADRETGAGSWTGGQRIYHVCPLNGCIVYGMT